MIVFLCVGPPPTVGDMVVIEGHGTVDTVKRMAAVDGDTVVVDDASHVTRNGLLVYETNAQVWQAGRHGLAAISSASAR